RNRSIAGQNLPPEFDFRPTQMVYKEPARKIVYEDAMGSKGTALMDPRMTRAMDPLHWRSDRSPMANVRETTNGSVAQLNHMLRFSRNSQTLIRKYDQPTVSTKISEPAGARKPLVRGRTPQEIARGAKAPQSAVQAPSMEKIQKIIDPRRGFRPGSGAGVAEYLADKPQVVESLASQAQRNEERRNEAVYQIGAGSFTEKQIRSLPPGYVKALTERAEQRKSKQAKPTVMFDPKESRGLSPRGQYTEIPRPGLVDIGNGKYVRPEQVGLVRDGTIGAFGDNAQPQTSGVSKIAAFALIGLGIVGAVMLVKR
ncbi:MAG: hypothetical protein ABII76_22225, partial [Pseudomonadota bacterium]